MNIEEVEVQLNGMKDLSDKEVGIVHQHKDSLREIEERMDLLNDFQWIRSEVSLTR